jgi:hypothetical protein
MSYPILFYNRLSSVSYHPDRLTDLFDRCGILLLWLISDCRPPRIAVSLLSALCLFECWNAFNDNLP